jgi:hypothetical protein
VADRRRRRGLAVAAWVLMAMSLCGLRNDGLDERTRYMYITRAVDLLVDGIRAVILPDQARSC